jgi:CheY-like chemotaxis protein
MAPRKSRILIADDNAQNVELMEAYLAGVDCDTAIAVDGADTLAQVAQFQPDLILLDVMMPKVSGFEVCKKLKSNPGTRSIMILMVTALNELGDIERAVNAGTDDFLSKPVNKVKTHPGHGKRNGMRSVRGETSADVAGVPQNCSPAWNHDS